MKLNFTILSTSQACNTSNNI